MKAAQLITPDGTITEIMPENGTNFHLRELYKLIGCGTIELAHTKDGRYLIMDEEGKLMQKPINDKATALYQYGDYEPIVGNVVVCLTGMFK